MPEGFSSIADLKVVVDASTEKLAGNLQLAKNVVTRFTEESNQQLGLFDRTMHGLGGGVSMLVSKANVWLGALQMVSSTMATIRQQGEQLAIMGGLESEYKELTAAYDEMLSAVQDGAPKALMKVIEAAKDYVTGGSEIERANIGIAESGKSVDASNVKTAQVAKASSEQIEAGLAELSRMTREHSSAIIQSNDETAASYQSMGERAVGFLIEKMKNISHAFRKMSDEAEWSVDTVSREMDNLAARMNDNTALRQEVMKAGMGGFDVSGSEQSMTAEIETIARGLDRINELTQMAADKRAEARLEEYEDIEEKAQAGIDAALRSAEREIQSLEEKARAYGMTKGDAAAYAAVVRIVNELTAKEINLSEDAAERLGVLADRIRDLTNEEEARATSKASADATERFLKSLDQELRSLDQQRDTLGMATTAVAAYNAEMRFRNQLADQGIKLSAAQNADVEKKVAQIAAETEALSVLRQARADEASQVRTFEQALLALQRQTLGLQAKTSALYDNSEAGRVNALVEQQLNELRARSVPITDERVAAIRREAAAQIDASLAYEEAGKKLEMLRDYGRSVTTSLENAFRQWTEGAKIDVKSMVASMLADLAQITFRRSVTDNIISSLFGGPGNGSGGLLSSLFGGGGDVGIGSWAPTVFGGFRANGGDVEPGKAYVVGEQRAELFIPSSAGRIAPSTGGGPLQITINAPIDARGASGDAITRLEAAMAMQRAELPKIIVQTVSEARDRVML